MTNEVLPQPMPIPPTRNGNGWKGKALGKLAENPVGFLDWAFKVGVSSAIGLYLVVSLTSGMKAYLAIQGEEAIKQTRQITEMALTTKEVSLSQGTIRDLSKAGRESAQAAQDAAGIAAKGMVEQKPILEKLAASSEKQAEYMGKMLTEQKRFLPAMEKMMQDRLPSPARPEPSKPPGKP